MPSLSVIILTKNEARNISEAVASACLVADEVIVCDSGSTDNTAELARAAGARVETPEGPWTGFGNKRRFAQSKCRCEFVMHLDADERITEKGAAEIKEALGKAGGKTVLALPRLTRLLGDPVKHCGWYPDYVLRVYPKDYTQYDEAVVHENLLLPSDAQVIKLKEPLIHDSYDCLERLYEKQAAYALAYGEKKRGKKVTLCGVLFKGMFAFFRTYFLRGGILDGKTGLMLSISNISYELNKYLAVYAVSQGKVLRKKDL